MKMVNLTVAITKLLKAVELCSSSPVVQWLLRILAMSQAITPAGWPPDYHLKDGEMFDFVVVGAGSAGAVVAARLSEVPHHRVLLVEAGGDPPLASVVPSLFATLTRTKYDWGYYMKYDKGVGGAHRNQQVMLVRGKMLGGSSSLNYEVYARGEPRDYDDWSEVADGWDWQSVLHYFKKLENMTDHTLFDNPETAYLHSTEGPVKISKPVHNDYFNDVNEIILNSYEEMGLKRVLEMNGFDSLGVSLPHFTLAEGRRSSTAESYLLPTKRRRNLFIAKYTRATKVLIDADELTAYGVELMTRSGKLIRAYANKEVIVSAGSINTPQLLMLSGIGASEELSKFNIHNLVDLPVGRNMQDHAFVPLVFSGERGLTSAMQHVLSATELDSIPAPIQNGFINLNKHEDMRQFQIFNTHIGAFASPVIQVSCETLGYDRAICTSIAEANVIQAIDWTFLVLLHPKSRGVVKLRSGNPLDDPLIISGYFRNEEDVHDLTEGLKFMQSFVNTSYYRSVKARHEKLDVRVCRGVRQYSDKYWRCYVRNTVGSLQHPVGTCAMGPGGVVDERLRVHGVNGLRVVDASVMPTIPGGNTNAPTMMIGEKAADMIKEDNNYNDNFIF